MLVGPPVVIPPELQAAFEAIRHEPVTYGRMYRIPTAEEFEQQQWEYLGRLLKASRLRRLENRWSHKHASR